MTGQAVRIRWKRRRSLPVTSATLLTSIVRIALGREIVLLGGLPDDHGPSPAGDGTIALPSQLDPRAQAEATAMSGYGNTHVGILSDPNALEALAKDLEATTGKP